MHVLNHGQDSTLLSYWINMKILDKALFYANGAALAAPGIGERNNFRHGAVLFDRRRIINAKYNLLKTHPKLSSFTKYPFLHAESNCIISHGVDNCAGLYLLVCRISMANELCLSKPCRTCVDFAKYANIAAIYYTTDERTLEKLVLTDV